MFDERRAALVRDWWEHYRLGGGGRAERKALSLGQPAAAIAADESVRGIVEAGGASVIELLRALAQAVSDDGDLAFLGAGPIEDFVDLHGVPAAAQVAETARLDPHFARAVAAMWMPADLAPAGRELLAPWVAGGHPPPGGAERATDPAHP